ncbi:MAG: 50S ribosomal protein L17 [Bacteroidales bacterium]|nr:50S ribosomal protein L17 [Bacteroidales bacterium]
MRHGCKQNKLSRTHAHRAAMLSNMASSLIKHKRIETTLAKAKVLRGYVEPLINRSKEDSTHSRRIVFSYLQDKEAVTELFREISQKVANRPGGYTRILKTGIRKGDNSEMAIIELVDYNENMLKENKPAKAKSTRRSRAKKTTAEAEPKAEAKAEEKVEEKPAEEPKAE